MQSSRDRRGEGGFTLVEILVFLVVAVMVIGSIYELVINQGRLYSKQRELMDVRSSLRAAASLLSWELRQAAPGDGDLYGMSTTGFTVRSILATGVVCSTGSGDPPLIYGLQVTSGEFTAATDDSVLVFAAGDVGTDDDRWVATEVADLLTVSSETCNWNDTPAPDILLQVLDPGGSPSPLADVTVGSPVRLFRRVEYGLFQADDERWWLGRRVGSAAEWEQLTGPVGPPADSGLALYWYDRSGNTTTIPDSVSTVEFFLSGESLKAVYQAGGSPAVKRDTLRTHVSVRG